MAIAMAATPAGGVLDMDCKANGLNGECLKQFVVMKHPYLNNIGLFFSRCWILR